MRSVPSSGEWALADDEERALLRDCAKLAFTEILRHQGVREALSPDQIAKAAFACAQAMVREYRTVLREAQHEAESST